MEDVNCSGCVLEERRVSPIDRIYNYYRVWAASGDDGAIVTVNLHENKRVMAVGKATG